MNLRAKCKGETLRAIHRQPKISSKGPNLYDVFLTAFNKINFSKRDRKRRDFICNIRRNVFY